MDGRGFCRSGDFRFTGVPGFREDYEAVKKAHPGDIVLYQLGDFYEMFGPDARVASHELPHQSI